MRRCLSLSNLYAMKYWLWTKVLKELFQFRATVASYVQKKSWKNLFAYMGPGFLVSIAYIDPGNCKICSFSIWAPLSDLLFVSFIPLWIGFWRSLWFFSVETDLQSGAQYKYEVRKWYFVVKDHILISFCIFFTRIVLYRWINYWVINWICCYELMRWTIHHRLLHLHHSIQLLKLS